MEEQPKNGPGSTGGGVPTTGKPPRPDAFVPLTQVVSHPVGAPAKLDLAAIRQKLAGTQGRQYWRSLEEVAETPGFQAYLEKEFPHQAPREYTPLARRDFLRLMGATLALAGVGGCAYQPAEKIVPYLEQPENLIPGKSLYYTTAFTRGGYALGLLGESSMGRPVKLEGNPDHPASLGATDAITQASLLGLYDPDRSQAVRYGVDVSSWENFEGVTFDHFDLVRRNKGAGMRLLIGPSTSPTLAAQLKQFQTRFPQARIHQYDPAGRDSVIAGAQQAFGQPLEPVYHFDRATRVVSLDSDFLLEEPGSVRYARDFMSGRHVREGRTEMNRLYVVEGMATITGAKADHRVPVKPGAILEVARALAASVGVAGAAGATTQLVPADVYNALVADLQSARGSSLVLAGPHQPAAVHALAFAINSALGNIGKTVTFHAPVAASVPNAGTLKELVTAMNAGQVGTLIICGCNPVYDAPADLSFGMVLRDKVKFRVHLGLYDDETGEACEWHLPESHYLEAWSDARSYDGTVSIIQPLITPLYGTRSIHELLAFLSGSEVRQGYDLVRSYWQGTNPAYAPNSVPNANNGAPGMTAGSTASVGLGGRNISQATGRNPEFERFWHQALFKGSIPNTASPAKTVALAAGFTAPASTGAETAGDQICFRPDATVWDGQYTNNAWLQELPKPITKLAWDNAAYVSVSMAERLKLNNGDMVSLNYKGRTVTAAVWIMPGHADGAVTLSLGYGRTRAGKVGTGTGFNAYALRTSDQPWIDGGLEVRPAGKSYQLVSAQQHFSLEGRDQLLRRGTLAEYLADPKAPHFMGEHGGHGGGEGEHGAAEGGEGGHGGSKPPSLYDEKWPSDRKDPGSPGPGTWGTNADTDRAYNGQVLPAWGMVIDVNACIGCNACTMACQAENNIATVGKDQVANNREMHWIRIDTYFVGQNLDHPDETLFQPLPCQHCEKAPCEPVCPVEATTHSAEGINEMTYNRCIGTRYCENNCPYKVRRFNYLQYSDQKTPTIQMMRNPDVTVRSRGVMEKCTYCVQRVNEARIEAEKENRSIRDGDVKSACQQVCPTQAILFGDINDSRSNGGKGSKVRQLKGGPLEFTVLEELNTRPRTTYLAGLKNLNPAISGAHSERPGGEPAGEHGTAPEGAAPAGATHPAEGAAPGTAPANAPATGGH